jgi:predicted CXXCH cytochrome family protein
MKLALQPPGLAAALSAFRFPLSAFRPLVLLLLALTSSVLADSVLDSKHNLSISGPGIIRAATETEICIFCHTPHRATSELPLWNHALSVGPYTPYASTTLKATVGQPTGASKLCLSCHDGTVALGMVNSRPTPIQMQNGASFMPIGRTRLGTDLSDDHPVSFTYDSLLASRQGELRDPTTLNNHVRVDHNSQMQCTSCHDPHNDQYGKFLVEDNSASALCLECHIPNFWPTSAHRLSSKTWSGTGPNPWPHTDARTVAANACENCHAPHTAGTPQRLMNFAVEEQNCTSCHAGSVASQNVAAEFNKMSVHPIAINRGSHDPMEDPVNPATRHVTCVDCHNPHAANSGPGVGQNISGALTGVRGINASGSPIPVITHEYELCFRCHADSMTRGQALVPRQYPETNTRLEFAATANSFHPVIAAGRNPNVPSLIAPLTAGSLIACSDCHNNNQGSHTGGTGPNGPHGSTYTPLLERNLALVDFQPENQLTYALCYKCHDSNKLLYSPTSGNDKEVAMHKKHVVDKNVACTTCHDSHGSRTTSHLINFNPNYVSANGGSIQFLDRGTFHGSCTLTCHTIPHDNSAY